MVEFEINNPLNSFLFGVDLVQGFLEDETPIKILSFGLIICKVSFMWVDNQ